MVASLCHNQKARSVPSARGNTEAFLSESNLVQGFLSVMTGTEGKSFHVLTEVASVNGIADVVMFRRHRGSQPSSLSDVPPRWAFALRAIPYRKKFTTEEFCGLALVQPKTARGVLQSFVDAGYCKFTNAYWIKIRQPVPVATEIIAVEAKLKDWNRALKQAYRYLDFANSTWVLLDEKRIEPAFKKIHEFQRLNVGLASISSNSATITVYFSPRKQKPRSEVRFWQANAILAQGC